MRKYLNKLPGKLKEMVSLASDLSARSNIPVYLVGGFVRDMILKKKNFDLDIVVEGDGIKFAGEFAKITKAKLITHSRFKTATLHLGQDLKIDISSARSELYPAPAQLPEVTLASMKEDLFRRDFTINAMAVDISKKGFARLIDYCGGKVDLKKGVIRVMHALSFIDDPTRILRAIRFEKRFGFRIESGTLGLLKDAKNRKMLEKVQAHRIRDELILMLKEEDPVKEVIRLKQLIGFDFIKQGLNISAENIGLLRSIKKDILWFRGNFASRRHLDSWLVYFMGLMESQGQESIGSICRLMALRKGEEKRLLDANGFSLKLRRDLESPKIRPSRIHEILKPLSYEVIVYIKAKSRNRIINKHISNFLNIYNGIKTSLTGSDLLQFGLLPGPDYRDILKMVLYARIDGLLKSRQDEEAFVRKILKNR
jgi:tRNA nucleotidyltransferase (CCA-adding enzyme)